MAVRPKIPGTHFARPSTVVRKETVAAWKSLACSAGLIALSGTALAFLATHIPPFAPSGSGAITGLTCYPGMADEAVDAETPDTSLHDLPPIHPNPSLVLPLPTAPHTMVATEPTDIPPMPEPSPEQTIVNYPLLAEEEPDPFGREPIPSAQPDNLPVRPKKTVRPAQNATASRPAARQADTSLAQSETIYGPGELDEQVHYKHTPMMPALPPHLKTPNSARVRITVSGNGAPISVTIIQSCGNPEVDNLLKHHILSHWTFHPAVRNGKTVGTNVTTSLNFS